MNKKIIGDLSMTSQKSPLFETLFKENVIDDSLPPELFGKCVRILSKLYLQMLNPQALLTSKKIDKMTYC